MKKYLSTPCPHDNCRKQTLNQPEPSNHRLYARCDSCGRKSLYVIHEKIDGSKSYSIVRVGAPNRNMERMTFFIPAEYAEQLRALPMRQQSATVRAALDIYFDR
jgi:hypothetical protein